MAEAMAEAVAETTDAPASTETSGEAFAAPDAAASTDAAQGGVIENDAFSAPKDDTEVSDAESEAGSEQEGEQDAPEQYEVSLPEGFALSDERTAEFTEWAQANNFSNEQAQNAIDLYTKLATEDRNAAAAQWQEQASIWTQASKAAGLLTGEAMSQAKAGLTAVDHDGSLGNTLHQLGLDHHPGIIEAFRSHGAAVSPPSDIPSAASDGPSRLATAAERMYPTMFKEE